MDRASRPHRNPTGAVARLQRVVRRALTAISLGLLAPAMALAVVPNAPSLLRADPPGANFVNLRWNDNSNNESEFRIAQLDPGEDPNDAAAWDNAGIVGPNVTLFQVSPLLPASTYQFKVRARNATGFSAYSNIIVITTASAVPATPSNLRADVPGAFAVTLRWADNAPSSGFPVPEDGYNISRLDPGEDPNDELAWDRVGQVVANVTSFSAAGLLPSTAYLFRVRGFNANGFSLYSNVISVTTGSAVPATPSNLRFDAPQTTSVVLRWEDNAPKTGFPEPEDGYNVSRLDPGEDPNDPAAWDRIGQTGPNAIAFSATGLIQGTTYQFRVRGFNVNGFSEYSNVVQVSTPSTVPAAPSNLTAGAPDAFGVVLTWVDNSPGPGAPQAETGFNISRLDDGEDLNNFAQWDRVATAGANQTSVRVAMPPSGHCWFRVRAVGANGFSAYSNVVEVGSAFISLEKAIGSDFPSGTEGEVGNTALGTVTRQFPLMTVRGPRGELPVQLFYSSRSTVTGELGPKWCWTLGARLSVGADSSVDVFMEDTRQMHWTKTASGFVGDTGAYDSLALAGDEWRVAHPSGVACHFGADGVLRRIQDSHGPLFVLSGIGGVPQAFTEPGGRPCAIETLNGLVTRMTDAIGRVWLFSYDGAGMLSTVTEPTGGVTHFSYDANGSLLAVVDAAGEFESRYSYDALGRVLSTTDALGGVTGFAYDDANARTLITNPSGETRIHRFDPLTSALLCDVEPTGDSTTYRYSAALDLIEVRDARGFATHYTYDSRGNVTTVTNASGGVTATTFDSRNHPLSVTDPIGGVTSFTYDPVHGDLLTRADPLGHVTRFAYGPSGELLETTDPVGAITTTEYDPQGNPIREVGPLGGVTQRTFDGVGRLLLEVDPLGRRETWGYDARDSVTSVSDSLGNVRHAEFDLLGRRVATVSPAGRRTTMTYDAKGRLIEIRDPLSRATSFQYDASDRMIRQTEPGGGVTQFGYDLAGRLTTQTDAVGAVTRFVLDPTGNPIRTTDPMGNVTQVVYDAMGRATQTTDPKGTVTSKVFDGLGRVTRTTNGRGYATDFTYDAAGQLTQVGFADGAVLQHEYDARGARIRSLAPNGAVTQFTYDAEGRLMGVTGPLGQQELYEYDLAGQRTRRTDAVGRVTDYAYDGAGRLRQIDYDDGGTIVYGYDPDGQRTLVSDPLGQSTIQLDLAGQVTSRSRTGQASVDYTFDPNGRVASIRLPGGSVVTYERDALGRITRCADWAGRALSATYDLSGRLQTIGRPGGTTSQFSYDGADQLVRRLDLDVLGDTVVSLRYETDANHNRTRLSRVDRRADPVVKGGATAGESLRDHVGMLATLPPDTVWFVSEEDPGALPGIVARARRHRDAVVVVPAGGLSATTGLEQSLRSLVEAGRVSRAMLVGGESDPRTQSALSRIGAVPERIECAERISFAAGLAEASGDAILVPVDSATSAAVVLFAARRGWPVLYTYRDSLPAVTRAALAAAGVSRCVLVGGQDAVSDAVAGQLGGLGVVVRARLEQSEVEALSVAFARMELDLGGRPDTVLILPTTGLSDVAARGTLMDPSRTVAVLVPSSATQMSSDTEALLAGLLDSVQQTQVMGGIDMLQGPTVTGFESMMRRQTVDYTYDVMDRLTSEIRPSLDTLRYTYDLAGNRVRLEHGPEVTLQTFDLAGRLLQSGDETFEYDAAGNRVAAHRGLRTKVMAYDHEQRMTSLQDGSASSRYEYDGEGGRIAVVENGLRRGYVIDHEAASPEVLGITDSTGAVLQQFIYLEGLAAEVDAAGMRYEYLQDALGSTTAIVDSLGHDRLHSAYRAYGEPTLSVGDSRPTVGFVGREGVWPSESGLLHMGRREYDPRTATFLSPDPEPLEDVDPVAGARYSYADGNPVAFTDPDGHAARIRIERRSGAGGGGSSSVAGQPRNGSVRNEIIVKRNNITLRNLTAGAYLARALPVAGPATPRGSGVTPASPDARRRAEGAGPAESRAGDARRHRDPPLRDRSYQSSGGTAMVRMQGRASVGQALSQIASILEKRDLDKAPTITSSSGTPRHGGIRGNLIIKRNQITLRDLRPGTYLAHPSVTRR